MFLAANRQAVLVRSGDRDAMVGLSHHIFLQVGVPPAVADSFHFTQRLVQTEADYRAGLHPAVHEEDIVNAVNNMANTLGGPVYTRTTQAEVRRLRMEALPRYPDLLASTAPPDAKGHYEALSKDMSPSEAVLIASLMVYQKIYSPKYQLTAGEKSATPDPAKRKEITDKRMREMDDLISGRTRKVDILTLAKSADDFLTDLQIAPTVRPEFGSVATPQASTQATTTAPAQKGGK